MASAMFEGVGVGGADLVDGLCVLCAGGVFLPHARADKSRYQEFYTPPDPLPRGRLGDLIRSEPSRLVLEPSGQLGAYVATGTRIMYRSTDGRATRSR